MKKLLMALMLLAVFTTVSARDTYSRNVSDLPAAALNTVKNNFKADVSLIKIDKDFGHVSEYEVILTDGVEITFDNKGNWKEIEMPGNMSVPGGFLPAGVSNFVKKNHKNAKIVGLKKDKGGYEVELSDDIEIEFDSNGTFKRYDR